MPLISHRQLGISLVTFFAECDYVRLAESSCREDTEPNGYHNSSIMRLNDWTKWRVCNYKWNLILSPFVRRHKKRAKKNQFKNWMQYKSANGRKKRLCEVKWSYSGLLKFHNCENHCLLDGSSSSVCWIYNGAYSIPTFMMHYERKYRNKFVKSFYFSFTFIGFSIAQ